MPSRNIATLGFAASILLAGAVNAASAVQPQRWTHSSEADFAPGQVQDAVVTNLGDVKLATGSRVISEMPEQASIIYDLQRIDEAIYVAAGPEAKLMRREPDGTLSEVLALPGEQVFTLSRMEGELLVAVSGANSRLAVLDGEELVTIADLPGVQYVWDIVVHDGAIYLATGTEGQVLRVGREADGRLGEVEVILEASQANVLTLATDAHGRLYAGTDTDGLIYRLTPSADGTWQPFVLYDAPEPEIGALLVLDDGTVYAGTADAEQARPGRLSEAATDPAGRPDMSPTHEPEPGEQDVPDADDIPAVPPDAEPIEDIDENGQGEGLPEEDDGEPDSDGDSDGDGDGNGESDEGLEDIEGIEDAPAEDPMRQRLGQWPHAGGQPMSSGSVAVQPTQAEAGAAEAVESGVPANGSRDRLREAVRARLMDARQSGTLQAGVQAAPRQAARRTPTTQRARPAAASRPTQAGNAIYRIDSQGFVNEVFRESVMVFKIVEAGGRLLVATGNEGQVFSVNPRTEETTIIADLDPEQVTSILVTDEGDLLMATANAAQLVQLDEQVASRGTYTSPVLDASQISLFGALRVTADIPENASLLVETRSGNVGDPDQAPWSAWSEAQTFRHNPTSSPLQPREMMVTSPPARFLQYRLTLLGNGRVTPVVSEVEMAYVMPNLPPRIRSVRARYADAGRGTRASSADAAPSTIMRVEWEASDPNEDDLLYTLEYQPAGSSRYILIADDIREANYEWQTRRVPDGRYILRVTASDRPSNPPDMAKTATRRSDAVLVDNTPPRLEGLAVSADGQAVQISGLAVDALSPIQSIAYAVNSDASYTPVLPEDLIFDSTRERFRVTITDLDPGHHVVTLRVRDTRGNTRFEAVMVEVE